MGVGWLSLGEPFNRWMYRVRRHVFLRTARPLIAGRPTAAVLDVGSGTGFYVRRWQELGAASITASDLTDVAARNLASAFPGVESRQLDVAGDLPDELRGRFARGLGDGRALHIVDDAAYFARADEPRPAVKPGGR